MRTGDSGMIDHCQVPETTMWESDRACLFGVAWRTMFERLGRSLALPSLAKLALVAGLGLLFLVGFARAAEPVQSFAEGLRDRGYYDIAIAYLDQLEQQGSLPVELKELLPYERAQTLLASCSSVRVCG